jgi:RNA polymerase sigma-70 factor (sigma-E family)
MELARLMTDPPPFNPFPGGGKGGEFDATITPIHGTPAIAGPSGLPGLPQGPGKLGFTELYLEHHDRLVRLAFVLTGSREIAEDVVQDSFVRLYNRWGAADHPDRYVRQIVVNECHSHHRRAGRERDRRAKLYVVDATTDRHSVELEDVLMELPYRQRAAIVLRFYSDLSEAEIAEVLGCRPGTVGSLIHRGLDRLRKAIEQ